MVRDGYLWNSGIFVWRVGDFLDEVRRHTPEVAPALEIGRETRTTPTHFSTRRSRCRSTWGCWSGASGVLVMPGRLRLGRRRDLGGAATGAAPGRCGQRHARSVQTLDAHDNVVHAESGAVVLYGVSDLVVVTRDGLTLVTTVDRSADLKTLVESLPPQLTAGLANRDPPWRSTSTTMRGARMFEPFALTRPVVGAVRRGDHHAAPMGERVSASQLPDSVVADHLRDFSELDAPPAVTRIIPARRTHRQQSLHPNADCRSGRRRVDVPGACRGRADPRALDPETLARWRRARVARERRRAMRGRRGSLGRRRVGLHPRPADTARR